MLLRKSLCLCQGDRYSIGYLIFHSHAILPTYFHFNMIWPYSPSNPFFVKTPTSKNRKLFFFFFSSSSQSFASFFVRRLNIGLNSFLSTMLLPLTSCLYYFLNLVAVILAFFVLLTGQEFSLSRHAAGLKWPR